MAKAEKKEQFADLSDEYKSAIDAMTRDEIKKRVAEVALENAALMKAKKDDGDLAEKRELYREAGSVYRDAAKQNKLKIEYAKAVLDSKGG